MKLAVTETAVQRPEGEVVLIHAKCDACQKGVGGTAAAGDEGAKARLRKTITHAAENHVCGEWDGKAGQPLEPRR